MATSREAHPAEKRPTWFGWAIGLPFRIIAVVVISILTSIVIEWIGIYGGWWAQPGAAHAQGVLTHELSWIDTQFTRSLIFSQPVEMARAVITTVYDVVFVATGIASWFDAHSSSGGVSQTIATYGQAGIDVSLVVLVRVFILTLTVPLFVMAAVVGIVDGLVRRDLRKFGAGRESAFIYHHAKRLTGPVFILGWLIYLSVPFSVNPNTFLVPCAALFGLLISVTTGSFKKYL